MIYWDLFLGFLKVGCFTFGGAYSAIPLIRDVVRSYGWLSDETLTYMIAVSESTPGPIIVNLATYVGNSQAGFWGAVLATLAVVLPSFFVILLIMGVLKNTLKNKYVQAILEPIHRYNDLWDWYNDYKQRNLDTYQSRRAFVRDIYAPLIDTLENSEENTTTLLHYEPTGWDLVDDGVGRMKDVLVSAEKTLDYQSVGMYGRELLITLAQTVFDKSKHPSTDGTDIGSADSKRMLDAYIHYCMHKKSKEREVKFAKASVDFSNELTHNRTATAMDAELCYNAVLSTVHIIRTLNKYND